MLKDNIEKGTIAVRLYNIQKKNRSNFLCSIQDVNGDEQMTMIMVTTARTKIK